MAFTFNVMTNLFVTRSCDKIPFTETENQLQYIFIRQRKYALQIFGFV